MVRLFLGGVGGAYIRQAVGGECDMTDLFRSKNAQPTCVFTLKIPDAVFAETLNSVHVQRGSTPKAEVSYSTPAAKTRGQGDQFVCFYSLMPHARYSPCRLKVSVTKSTWELNYCNHNKMSQASGWSDRAFINDVLQVRHYCFISKIGTTRTTKIYVSLLRLNYFIPRTAISQTTPWSRPPSTSL
jgi:hypothetical protein